MTTYIDKSAVVAEIERLKESFVNEHDGFEKGYHYGLDMVLSFLDTTETKEVDLEKDVNEIIKTAEDHAYFAGSENTREKLIDKACKWLKKWDAYRVCLEGHKDWFIEQFRKAMKE